MQISLPPNTWVQITYLIELALALELSPSGRDALSEALSTILDELDRQAPGA